MPRPDIIMVRQLAVASQNVAFPLVDKHRAPAEQERDALTALDELDQLSQRIRRELGGLVEDFIPEDDCGECGGKRTSRGIAHRMGCDWAPRL